jgi:hypothetical protein
MYGLIPPRMTKFPWRGYDGLPPDCAFVMPIPLRNSDDNSISNRSLGEEIAWSLPPEWRIPACDGQPSIGEHRVALHPFEPEGSKKNHKRNYTIDCEQADRGTALIVFDGDDVMFDEIFPDRFPSRSHSIALFRPRVRSGLPPPFWRKHDQLFFPLTR